MDGKQSVVSSPSASPPPSDPWVAERTTYDFAVAGNKSLAQAMMSVVRKPRYNVNKDKRSQHGPATETRGPTLLHVFARNGWTELVVDLVTRRGVHPDETPSDGPWFTPLYHALDAGHHELAATLINHGADVCCRGKSYGMLNALVGLPPEKFDKALTMILTAVAQKMGKPGTVINWALWQISSCFAKMAPYYPRRITDTSPVFLSLKESVRGTLVKFSKVEKEIFDKYCGIVWDLCGSSEAPLQMAAKAGSIIGVVLFVALGFHEGLYEFGSNGRTALMEACVAIDEAYGHPEHIQRLLTVVKFLLAVARVNPNVRVPQVKRAGADVGKYALNFVPCDIGAPLGNLLIDYGAAPQCMKTPSPRMSPGAPGGFDSDISLGSIFQQLQNIFPVKGSENWVGDMTINADDKGRNVRFGAFQLG